jgi:hypothetical protein
MDSAQSTMRSFGYRFWTWLLAAVTINWLLKSVFLERFLAAHGYLSPYRAEDIVAILAVLVFAWMLGLLDFRMSWLQGISVVGLSLAMPTILLFFLLTVGCWVETVVLHHRDACL